MKPSKTFEYGTKHPYCIEDVALIENYDRAIANPDEQWTIHHRAEILPCGEYTSEDLEKWGLYWLRPACELIFLTRSEHAKLHSSTKMFKKIHNDAAHRIIGKYKRSAETRKKISDAAKRDKTRKGNKYAVGGKGHMGLKWITDGKSEKTIPIGKDPPKGWKFGRNYTRKAGK